jgi:c-di-GMP-binding flagellar brake protein YcgR
LTENSHLLERRDDYRAIVNYPLWYRHVPKENRDDVEWERTMTRDLSAGGAHIWGCLPSLSVGDLLEIQIIIPPRPVFTIAQVVRIMYDEDNRAESFGVAFLSIAQQDRDRIASVVLKDGLGRNYD